MAVTLLDLRGRVVVIFLFLVGVLGVLGGSAAPASQSCEVMVSQALDREKRFAIKAATAAAPAADPDPLPPRDE
jgi:hypothetical protein